MTDKISDKSDFLKIKTSALQKTLFKNKNKNKKTSDRPEENICRTDI
jgi:hypothetical protein